MFEEWGQRQGILSVSVPEVVRVRQALAELKVEGLRKPRSLDKSCKAP